jgi:hypothetical protein
MYYPDEGNHTENGPSISPFGMHSPGFAHVDDLESPLPVWDSMDAKHCTSTSLDLGNELGLGLFTNIVIIPPPSTEVNAVMDNEKDSGAATASKGDSFVRRLLRTSSDSSSAKTGLEDSMIHEQLVVRELAPIPCRGAKYLGAFDSFVAPSDRNVHKAGH